MSEQTKDFLSELSGANEVAEQIKAEKAPEATAPVTESTEITTTTDEPAKTVESAKTDTGTTPDEKVTHGQLAGMLAEREKRQAAEAKLRELEQKLAEQAPKPEAKQFWEDPEGVINQRIQQAVSAIEQRNMAMMESRAKADHPDYLDVIAYFTEQAKADPLVAMHAGRVMREENPAEAAYQFGKRLQAMNAPATTNVDDLVNQKVAERMAAWEQEQQAKAEQTRSKRNAIPPDLTATRSTKDDGDFAMEDVFDALFQPKE